MDYGTLRLAMATPSVLGMLACGSIGGRTAVAPPLEPTRGPSGRAGHPSADGGARFRAIDYPRTRVEDVSEVHFGNVVNDPYRWLENGRAPDVQAWMNAQDRLARDYLSSLPARKFFATRLERYAFFDDARAPVAEGGRYFTLRFLPGRERPVLYWQEGLSGEPRVLIDPNAFSDPHVSLGAWSPSPDGKRLAYALSPNNADEATLHVMDVETRATSAADVIEGAKYADPQWTPDGSGFYYTWVPVDPSIPSVDVPGQAEIRFHRCGTSPRNDILVHPSTGDRTAFMYPKLSRDGRWLFVLIQHGWAAMDIFFRDLEEAGAHFVPLVTGRRAIYDVTAWRGRFFLLTDDGAPAWKVISVPEGTTALDDARTVVPERPGMPLEGMAVLGGHLVLRYLERACEVLEVRTLDGEMVRRVPLPEWGSIPRFTGTPGDDEMFIEFSSFTRRPVVYRTSISSGETALWSSVSLDADTSRVEIEQVRYRSRDGTLVSMFLVYRRGMVRDGSTPFLLTGYGGFNVSLAPRFQGGVLAWLDAGGGFAMANVRGGGEYGKAWHRAGMMHEKQNTFDDFIAAAEYLVAQRYTRPESLAIEGGSNGGLLVGAAMVQRPELFRAVVCAVPLLDMVRYHLSGGGQTWIPEYGSPDKEEDFKVLFGYSPYHQLVPGAGYPAVLVLSADSDDRVDPMHARKFVARLQSVASSHSAPVLLRIERHAGHGGSGSRTQAVERGADVYAFLADQLDMPPPAGQDSW